ncbi:MAG TPA: fatty acid desaturase [Bacillota bacterium]|nr:fatty acid desaturase [Bacillota bacterium]
MEYIPSERIRKEKWKFYFVLFAWPLYLFLLPQVSRHLGLYTLFLMIFPGVYLFTWTGYLMHECWHKYVPNIPNKLFYHLFSWLLFTDPQIYNMLHGSHHMNVNTWEDTEFHPLGQIKNIHWRRLYNFLEIFLGVIFVTLIALFTLPSNPKYKQKFKWSSLITAIIAWIVLFGGLGYLAHIVFKINASQIALSFTANMWLCSFILHHSQLVEHGNLIVNGSYQERNIKTRNMRNQGLIEKLFLFLTHGDSMEHVLHHTLVTVYSRPFPGKVPMPENAIYIGFKEYLSIVWEMLSLKNAEVQTSKRVNM